MQMLLDFFTPAMIGSFIRTLMASAAGAVVANGWANADEWTAISGGAVALAVLLWSRFAKKNQGVI